MEDFVLIKDSGGSATSTCSTQPAVEPAILIRKDQVGLGSCQKCGMRGWNVAPQREPRLGNILLI